MLTRQSCSGRWRCHSTLAPYLQSGGYELVQSSVLCVSRGNWLRSNIPTELDPRHRMGVDVLCAHRKVDHRLLSWSLGIRGSSKSVLFHCNLVID